MSHFSDNPDAMAHWLEQDAHEPMPVIAEKLEEIARCLRAHGVLGETHLASLQDWRHARLMNCHGEYIRIDHPDEAALGRLYMKLVAVVQAANR